MNNVILLLLSAPQFVKLIGNAEVEKLVTYVKNNFRVDTKRIYFVGFSLGSRMSENYAAYKPSEIAAVVGNGRHASNKSGPSHEMQGHSRWQFTTMAIS